MHRDTFLTAVVLSVSKYDYMPQIIAILREMLKHNDLARSIGLGVGVQWNTICTCGEHRP